VFNADKSQLLNKLLDAIVYERCEDVNVQDNYNGETPLHSL
jgi:hypothetical protein